MLVNPRLIFGSESNNFVHLGRAFGTCLTTLSLISYFASEEEEEESSSKAISKGFVFYHFAAASVSLSSIKEHGLISVCLTSLLHLSLFASFLQRVLKSNK